MCHSLSVIWMRHFFTLGIIVLARQPTGFTEGLLPKSLIGKALTLRLVAVGFALVFESETGFFE